jgi:hypothetical protein
LLRRKPGRHVGVENDLDEENPQTHIASRSEPLLWVSTLPKLNGSFDLEDPMNDRMFDSSVFVKSENSLTQEIACIEDALEFLYEWPKNRRGPIYHTALRACQRAFDSNYPRQAARAAFCGFAKASNILQEVSAPPPWMTSASGRGGLAA